MMMTAIRTILLVEDDDTDAELVLARIRRANLDAEIHHRRTVEEGLALLEAHQGREWVVLTDLALPGAHGLELVRLAKQQHLVFVITSARDPREHAAALAAGARNVFQKPLSRDDLGDILDNL